MELPLYDGPTFGAISVAHTVAIRALSVDEIQGISRKDKEFLDGGMSRVV